MAKRSSSISPDRIREFARAGAENAIKELRARIAEIEAAFPELRSGGRAAVARATAPAAPAAKRRRSMSAAEKKAVSARMKKYWAARRQAKAKAK